MAIRRTEDEGAVSSRAMPPARPMRIDGVTLLRAAGGRLQVWTNEGRVLHWRVRPWDIVLVGVSDGNPPRPARRLGLTVRFEHGATLVLERRGRRVAVAIASVRDRNAARAGEFTNQERVFDDDAESAPSHAGNL